MGPAGFGRGSGSLEKSSYEENDTGEHGTSISVFLNQVSLISHGQYIVLTHKLKELMHLSNPLLTWKGSVPDLFTCLKSNPNM